MKRNRQPIWKRTESNDNKDVSRYQKKKKNGENSINMQKDRNPSSWI